MVDTKIDYTMILRRYDAEAENNDSPEAIAAKMLPTDAALKEVASAVLYMKFKDVGPAVTAALKTKEPLDIINNGLVVGMECVAKLYAEFVQNNNKIADILGYDNYLEYAYENVYGRNYSHEDVAEFIDYIIKYISPSYNATYDRWSAGFNFDANDEKQYKSVISASFFTNNDANLMFNNYLDDMAMAFGDQFNKQFSFSDELNGLVSNGNLFRGEYSGAFVTYFSAFDIHYCSR